MTKEREKGPPDEKPKTVRKPYVKPAFRSERVFETMALSCGKTAGIEGQCHMVLKRS
jgi:hypothetical protein